MITELQSQPGEWLAPLRPYYASAGVPLPQITGVRAEDIPQPYHGLLVHDEDMTSVLERFHCATIQLELLRVETQNGLLTRQVVLEIVPTCEPAEFGAIHIHLNRFDPPARERILEARRPLGGILKEHGIAYISRPRAFFRVTSDAIINRFLRLSRQHQLFGRYNVLSDTTGRSLAEVIEILPPMYERKKEQM